MNTIVATPSTHMTISTPMPRRPAQGRLTISRILEDASALLDLDTDNSAQGSFDLTPGEQQMENWLAGRI